MKKLLIIGGTVLLSGLVIAPKIIGLQLTDNLTTVVNTIDSIPGYNASLIESQSNWFATEAQINISVDTQQFPSEGDFDLTNVLKLLNNNYTIEFQHGPLLFSDNGWFGLVSFQGKMKEDQFAAFIEKTQDTPLYSLSGFVDVMGEAHYTDSIADFALKNYPFSFNGYAGKGLISSNKFRYSGKIDAINIENESNKIALNHFDINWAANGELKSIGLGKHVDMDSITTLKEMVLTGDELSKNGNFSDIAVSINQRVDEEKNLVHSAAKFTVGTAALNGFTASSMLIESNMNNLDSDVLSAYQNFATSLDTSTPEATIENTKAFALEHLVKLARHEPEFNLDKIEGDILGGRIDGYFRTKLVKFDQLPEQLTDSQFWLSKLSIDSDTKIDQKVLKGILRLNLEKEMKVTLKDAQLDDAQYQELLEQQVTATLSAIEQGGMVKLEDDKYRIQFSLQDGKGLLNGQPIPIPVK